MFRSKILTLISTISLAVIMFLIPCLTCGLNSSQSIENNESIQTRTIKVTQKSIDYESVFNDFEDGNLQTNGSITTFEGYKTLKLKDLENIDEINKTDVDEEVIIKYTFSYDSELNIVTLNAVLDDGQGQPLIDTIYGVGFLNDAGEIDAVMNVDGEGILLSEMRNAGMIENCGWFSRFFRKIVRAVAVVAAAVAVVATVAAVVVATAGAAAPAVVAAGVGIVTGTAATTTALATTCLTVAMVAAGISLASVAVSTVDFEGVKYELKEYSKVAKELVKGFYYLAVGDSEGRMLVSPVRLPTVAAAAAAMSAGLSVYSPDPIEAYAAAQLAGGGLPPVLDGAHQNGYFAHYHAFGRPKPSSHAFYGAPTTKGSIL